MDWRGAFIVPLYKGKGDKSQCSNSRGISLLSVVGKLFGRVPIKRVRAGTECATGEEQCGFRQGRGCNVVRKGEQARDEMVKDVNGQILV